MQVQVRSTIEVHRLRRAGADDAGPDVELVNAFLAHLGVRCFSPATVRAYAYDLLNFLRFLLARRATLAGVVPTDLFDYLDWQQRPVPGVGATVVQLGVRRGAAPASMNRRIAAVRGLFEFAVTSGVRVDNPVAVQSSGLRAKRRGLLGNAVSGRSGAGGRLVREPRRLPESLDREQISGFLADLGTSRDRAMVLLMALGGLRAAEVRGVRLADVDMGLRGIAAAFTMRVTIRYTSRRSMGFPETGRSTSGPVVRWPRQASKTRIALGRSEASWRACFPCRPGAVPVAAQGVRVVLDSHGGRLRRAEGVMPSS